MTTRLKIQDQKQPVDLGAHLTEIFLDTQVTPKFDRVNFPRNQPVKVLSPTAQKTSPNRRQLTIPTTTVKRNKINFVATKANRPPGAVRSPRINTN